MERNKKVEIILVGMLVLQAVVSAVLFPNLPDRIPAHWNIDGQVDRWMSPFGSITLFFCLSIGLYLLFWVIPLLDPKKKIAVKQKAYNAIRLVAQSCLLLFFFFVMAAAFGFPFPIDRIIPAVVSIMIIIFGNYMGKIRPNYFMGFRTPWTLEDPVVWQKTHRVGGPILMLAGFIGLIGCFLGRKTSVFLLITPMLAGCLFIVGYSWYQFQRLHPK